MPINSSPNLAALLAAKQDISGKDQPNGYVGLNSNSYIDGSVVLRESTGSDVPSSGEFVLKGDKISIGDGVTVGGDVVSGDEKFVLSLYKPSDGVLMITNLDFNPLTSVSLSCKTSSGQYAVDWWDGTRTLHDSDSPAGKAPSDNRLKIVKAYPATSGSSITEIDINFLSAISYLNVNNMTELVSLKCATRYLSSLDVSSLASLSNLECRGGPGGGMLETLDVGNLLSLSYLDCTSNLLTSLDVSGLLSLNTLWCDDNLLTSLDVSDLSSLVALSCGDNSITSLDISGLLSLNTLYCYSNPLTSLRAVGCVLSYQYYAYGSYIGGNLLDADALNQFFTDLGEDVGATGIIDITGNPGAATCDPTIATAKGYTIIGA